VREQLVITFQSIMFVSLGFLTAVLLGFIIAPAFWARAVRLTSERMRASLPLTEREIRAENDRVRAENAIRIYRLSAERDKAQLSEARQRVEINRRDAAIGEMERRVQRLETENEASENARRVLEATLKERMPDLEKRLVEARQLLALRDNEMKALRQDASKTLQALDEAMQANAQQRGEIDRLKTSLSVQSGRPASRPQVPETEAALRSELESLRARTRDQADVIKRLQAMMRSGARDTDTPSAASSAAGSETRAAELAAVQEGLEASREALLAQARTLSEKVEEQAGEISDLRKQLAEATASGGGKGAARGGKAKIDGRIAAKDKEIAERDKTIAGLRREIAQANERIARQASYYMEELRRLGSGGSKRQGARGETAGTNGGASGEETHVAQQQSGEVGSVVRGETGASMAENGDVERVGETERDGGKELVETAGDAPRPKLMERIAGITKR